MAFQVDIRGIPEVIRALNQLATTVMQPLGEALRTEGNQIIRVANTLVPVDTGLLRSTGAVLPPVQQGTTVSVELRYGGHGLAPYALVVHEDVTMNHPNGGQAKYLQDPVLAAVDGLAARLAADLPLALRS